MKSRAWTSAATVIFALVIPASSLHAQDRVKPSDSTPKVELFLGYTHFGALSSDVTVGNRMVGLNGGSASIAFNFNRYLGLVADFGGYDASQLYLTGTGTNLPRNADASGTAYSYMAGPRLSFNKARRISPFVQALFGGVEGGPVTLSNCTGALCVPLPKQSTFAMTGGGGLDVRVTHHIAVRVFQAEYMMTRFSVVPSGASGTQNDLRLSTGLVIRFGGSASRLPVQLSCNVQPQSVFTGEPVTVAGTAQNLDMRRRATYTWTSDASPVTGSSSSATIGTAALAAGTYTVKGHISEGMKAGQTADCSAEFTVRAFDPPTVSCSANPSSARPGDSVEISANGMSPQNRPLTYSYNASAGSIHGSNSSATLSTAGALNSITVTCGVLDDKGQAASATTSIAILAPSPVAAMPSPPPPSAPMVSEMCTVHFDRDHARPTRVDNEAKGCLDDIALTLQRSPDAKLALVGNTNTASAKHRDNHSAAERAFHTKAYLVQDKGIDSSRIVLYTGTADARSVNITLVPSGASLNGTDLTPVSETRSRGKSK